MKSNQKTYIQYCKENEVPFYAHSTYLNIAAPNQWQVAIVEDADYNLQAALPYVVNKKYGLFILTKPELVPYNDLIVNYPENLSQADKYSFKKKMVAQILEQLPSTSLTKLFFPYEHKNVQPFLWHNFKQKISYTHIFDDLSNLDEIYNGFRRNIKREIKKGQELLTIEESTDLDLVYNTLSKSFERQNVLVPYTKSTFVDLVTFLKSQFHTDVLVAIDKDNNCHGTLIAIYQKDMAYTFLSGADAQHKKSGVSSLLRWTVIQKAQKMSKKFNFLASNIEPIEHYISGFGGQKAKTHQLYKTKNKFTDVVSILLNK